MRFCHLSPKIMKALQKKLQNHHNRIPSSRRRIEARLTARPSKYSTLLADPFLLLSIDFLSREPHLFFFFCWFHVNICLCRTLFPFSFFSVLFCSFLCGYPCVGLELGLLFFYIRCLHSLIRDMPKWLMTISFCPSGFIFYSCSGSKEQFVWACMVR